MTARPRLVRSVPYWVLVVGSVAAGGVGVWLTLDKLDVMTNAILDGSATGVDVYAGQSWAVLGSILIGVGLIGLAFALTLAAAASLVKRAEPEVVIAESFDDADDLDDDLDDKPEVETVVVLDDASADPAAPSVDFGTATEEKVTPTTR
ncbi:MULTISPECIES: dinucleotide-utilizing enzyme [Bacteria]